ncbi:hypothetical protein BN59_00437 [Legionella massiliensis]|uniref:Coiled-coil protein n=1 Tax=Legionella massiliensis TaxID=1034943 RepID=A0A078KSX2_9GAMM|nr:hypothetical protein [Legionella massiliensis]CDZ76171.1 hypothetical protein BN59_00437 [Legionella massiliensis]CEE11909.1 hypothetical protein BN1094_00437 [Legionella massiliensis]
MVSRVKEAQFIDVAFDKRDFFATVTSIDEARMRANDEEHNYDFVGTNIKLIRQEFELYYNLLLENDVNHDIFWFYCYYCCIMLQNYHQAYGQKEEAKKFLKLRIQIRKRCITGEYPKDPKSNDSFIAYLAKAIAAGLVDWLTTPTKISKIKDTVAFANISRIYWFFCRTSITKSFLLARDLDLIDRIGSVFGKKIDVDGIINTLEKPNAVLRVLSVGFFAARFIINGGTILKHVLFPSKQEQALHWYTRLANDFYDLHPEMLNDIVWGTVNFLTNYNELVHIAGPTAGWIVAGFLFFDFCLILWKRHLAKREYEVKRTQLCSDLQYYQDLAERIPNTEGLGAEELNDLLDEKTMLAEHCRLLNEQIKRLDIQWQAKSATYWFNASAALLLMAGFSASMIFSPPIMVLACYMLCTFAVAMYLSDGAYNKYKEKSLLLDNAGFENLNYDKYLAEYKQARNDFYLTMAKNVVMPALLITMIAVCWQAAVAVALLYIGYQLLSSASKHAADNKNPEDIAIELELLSEEKPLKKEMVQMEDSTEYEPGSCVPCF